MVKFLPERPGEEAPKRMRISHGLGDKQDAQQPSSSSNGPSDRSNRVTKTKRVSAPGSVEPIHPLPRVSDNLVRIGTGSGSPGNGKNTPMPIVTGGAISTDPVADGNWHSLAEQGNGTALGRRWHSLADN